jgi:hypothetical protein
MWDKILGTHKFKQKVLNFCENSHMVNHSNFWDVTRSARFLLVPRPRQPARACSYRRGLLHGECNAVIRRVINLI